MLELVPDNYETMKILGSLYASKGETEKARGLLSRAVEHLPEDIEAVLELAQLLETIDYKVIDRCCAIIIYTIRKLEIPTSKRLLS